MAYKEITGRHAASAKRLRAIRDYLGFERSMDFADAIGAPRKSYSQWESGDFRISLDYAAKIQDQFGITLDFIYLGISDGLSHKAATSLKESPWLKE